MHLFCFILHRRLKKTSPRTNQFISLLRIVSPFSTLFCPPVMFYLDSCLAYNGVVRTGLYEVISTKY